MSMVFEERFNNGATNNKKQSMPFDLIASYSGNIVHVRITR